MTLFSPNVITVIVTLVSPEGFGQESHWRRADGDLFPFVGRDAWTPSHSAALSHVPGAFPSSEKRIFVRLGIVCRCRQGSMEEGKMLAFLIPKGNHFREVSGGRVSEGTFRAWEWTHPSRVDRGGDGLDASLWFQVHLP